VQYFQRKIHESENTKHKMRKNFSSDTKIDSSPYIKTAQDQVPILIKREKMKILHKYSNKKVKVLSTSAENEKSSSYAPSHIKLREIF
jgi:tRNA U34 5-carboxymethylaminomethyl modifying enzyme MnmG/GidA